MPANRSPTVRRRELGALLRALRTEKGWTAEEVAERLLVSPSKISRQETGQRGVSQRDIRELCDLYGVEGDQRQHLIDLASEGKQRAWWQTTRLPYSTYVGLEAEAVSISDYALSVMPGLLQTSEYARAVLEAMVPRWVPEIVEERVQGRLDRQERILAAPGAPRFEAVMDESVLHRVVGSPEIMRAQLEHLLTLLDEPAITSLIGNDYVLRTPRRARHRPACHPVLRRRAAGPHQQVHPSQVCITQRQRHGLRRGPDRRSLSG